MSFTHPAFDDVGDGFAAEIKEALGTSDHVRVRCHGQMSWPTAGLISTELRSIR